MSVNSFGGEKHRVAHRKNASSLQLIRDLAFKKQSMSQMVNRLTASKSERPAKKENGFYNIIKTRVHNSRTHKRKVISSDEEEFINDDDDDDEEIDDDDDDDDGDCDYEDDDDEEEDDAKDKSRNKLGVDTYRSLQLSPSLAKEISSNQIYQSVEKKELNCCEENLTSSLEIAEASTYWLCKPRLNANEDMANSPLKVANSGRRKRAVLSSSDEENEEYRKAPLTLKITIKRAKRLKSDVHSSDESDAVDSEASAQLSDMSESSESMKNSGKSKSSKEISRLEAACTAFFNTATREKLMSAPRITEKVATFIMHNRPFVDFNDLQLRISECPRGSAIPKLYVEYLENRGVLERILDGCRMHSKLMQEALENADSKQLLVQPKLLTKNCKLHEYQLVGLNWLIMMHRLKLNAILGDEMGLGKTIQVIAFLAYLKEIGSHGPHLIVCPSSTIENWMVEMAKWAPTINVLTYYGSMEDRMRLRAVASDTAVDVLLTTYNMIGSKPEDRKFFKRFRINYAIYDEGHLLKNCMTERYKNLMKVRGERKILMTGTPLQNNLIELISLMYFTMTKLFTEYCDDISQLLQQFQQKIPALTAKTGSLFGADKIEQAKGILKPYILRRLKANVLGCLPKKHEKVIHCEMTEAQKKIYDDLVLEFRQLDNGEVPASSRLMQLRQVSNHPLLYRRHYLDDIVVKIGKVLCEKENDYSRKNPSHVAEDLAFLSDFAINQLCSKYLSTKHFCLDERVALESGKFIELDKILSVVKKKGDKVLIFSQFTTMLDILEAYLRLRSYKYCRLDGSTPVMERQELINQFNTSEDIFAFLLSTKAGGMGINLAAANHIVLHDIDFNPYNDKQAEDRCHRMGQEKEVYVTRLVSAGTVEEAMLSLAEKKLELEKEVTGEGSTQDTDEGQMVEQLLKKALAS